MASPASQSQLPEEPTSRKQKKAAVRRMQSLIETALPLLQRAVTLASAATGDARVPGLSVGLSALAEILEQIQTMKKTVKGVDALSERVVELSKILTDFYGLPRTQPMPKDMKKRLEGLSKKWERVAGQAAGLRDRSRARRFFFADSDAEKLGDLVQQINESMQQDFMKGLLNIEEYARKTLAVDEKVLEESFMPTYAKGAPFDAFGPKNIRGACLKGTRVKALEEVFEWITDACLREGVTTTRNIYWYNGWAGIGKTTIACSIAEWCLLKGILAGSFFCSRFDAECSDPNSIFRTLSRQICQFSPAFKEKVTEILAKDSTIVHSTASRQFKELILRPLQELEREHRPFPRCVIIIDALDECSDPDLASVVLKILADSISDVAPFLVFIVTSRPEWRITYLFDSALRDATTPCLLHMIELESVSNDIRHYLETCFTEVRGYFKLKDWPPTPALYRLTELSAGLFIWAAIAVRFIRDNAVGNPDGQLKLLLNIRPTSQDTTQIPANILDPLYGRILQAAFPAITGALTQRLQSVLGTIVLALEPLSVATLEGLTSTKASLIRYTLLRRLHFALHIPDDNNEPIRVIHPTFAEYLLRSPLLKVESYSPNPTATQSSLSKLESFSINAAVQHARLFSRTLDIINNLEPNIAGFPSCSMLRNEIPGLVSTVKERIPPTVSYSCRYWSAHLERCGITEQTTLLSDSLSRFFRTNALTWLEACSLLEALDHSVAALQTAHKVCQEYGTSLAPLVEFISDCLRFTQTYYACIEAAPLQLYQSLLALAPNLSLVRQQYAPGLKQSLLIAHGAPTDWGSCVSTFVGHNHSKIHSVSFSADGAYFATGGGDGYIRIWRTATRTSVKTIPAGVRDHRVAFFPDGARIASAPDLRIWDVKTGDVVHTLEHKDAKYVACSADGTRLASGSDDRINLWGTSTGNCLDTITSVRAKWGIAISPYESLVGGNTAEDYPAICNTLSKASEVLNQEEGGRVAAFSPDGRCVASHAAGTVTVWALEDRSAVCTIDTSSDALHVTFSYDSTQVGCACCDGYVRIWTVASDDPPRVFAGHTGGINALAWSPDDTQVISVGDDGTIRVWDLTRHLSDTTLAASPPSSLPPLPGTPCYAVLRSPLTAALFPLPAPVQPSTATSATAEDAPLLTLHADMADAWDAILRGDRASGELAAFRDWAFLTGRLHVNMDEGRPVTWTSDGLLSVYEPKDGAVKVYSLRAGEHCLSLERSSSALALSPDNTRLAIAFHDSRTLSVWNVTSPSDSPISEFELDSFSKAVAFSHGSSLIVTATDNSDVHIYDATDGRSVKHLHGTRGEVKHITFSADDRHVVAQAHPWLIIWDVTTGDQILEFTPTHNYILHSFDFALDDTGILILDGKGQTTKVTLWSPGERTWPAYAVTEDGWLYAKSPGKARRLCWLPPEWRTVFSMGGPRFCSPDLKQQRAVVFNVSRIPEYLETWGVESDARVD